jgi:hypothetical protein
MRSVAGLWLVGGIVGAVVALGSGMSGCGSSSSNPPPSGNDGSAGNDTGTMDSTVETSVPQDSAADTTLGSDAEAEGGTPDGSPEGTATDGSPEGSTHDAAADSGTTDSTTEDGTTDGAAEGGGPSDAAPDTSSPVDSGTPSDGGDAGDAGCVTLNVYNFLAWCSVSVNAGAFSTAASQTVCVSPGSIPLEAKPKNSAFELAPDPWLYISGPGGTDSGEPGVIDGGVSAAAVVVGSTPGCVLVCCPFSANGMGCDPRYGMTFTNWEMNCP